jgi:2-methylisocitrate lyase-like PEP mutase family enzyme
MTRYQTFKQLHHQSSPLLLANAWDANSALIFEKNGYTAIGTSSHAVAGALGYTDGENIGFDTLLDLAKRIVSVTTVPCTIDMESGYSKTVSGILNNIHRLHDAGVAGINIEDSVIDPTGRKLQPAESFQKTVAAIAAYKVKNNLGIFINLRTDAFLLGVPDAISETISRAQLYENAGADGIFAPCITEVNDIQKLVNATALPVNVMFMPQLPPFEKLKSLGVKRISMGGFFFNTIQKQMESLAKRILSAESVHSITT